MANSSENPVLNHYLHNPERVLEHIGDLQKQAENPQGLRLRKREKALPMEQVVFERRHVDLFNEALTNPDHRLRSAAERAMQWFTVTAERAEVATLSQASREYQIPLKNLSDWVRKGLLPYTREKNAILLRREALDKVAPVYREANEHGKQAAPILKEMHDELFPASPKNTGLVDKA
jgi:hypothetical protein